MISRDCDLYDSVLSSWENEGGASAVVPDAERGLRYASDDILRSFGQSVVTHWNELPHGFKQAVFQEIVSACDVAAAGLPGLPRLPGLKEQAARFLHNNSSRLVERERRPARAGKSPSRVGFAVSFPEKPGSLHDFDSGHLGETLV